MNIFQKIKSLFCGEVETQPEIHINHDRFTNAVQKRIQEFEDLITHTSPYCITNFVTDDCEFVFINFKQFRVEFRYSSKEQRATTAFIHYDDKEKTQQALSKLIQMGCWERPIGGDLVTLKRKEK